MNGEQEHWDLNYFNYFTEVEERFQQARGTALFLLSPLDWALIEDWKNAGVPLEAVLRGIDRAFEKWRAGRSKIRSINSLAYCAQAVLEEAEAMQGIAPAPTKRPAAAPFELDELRSYLTRNGADLRKQAGEVYAELAASLEALATDAEKQYEDLEDLERRLTVLEEKMIAFARTQQAEDDMLEARRALDLELRPYRGKMSADQLARLERQYLDRRLLESLGLPRLSLFYMR
ncbi:MAG: hypothetical protein LLG20_23475 [Acidobacteriales bacterium]|nr:hypothetical protein [Terriglobales bacterium]